MGLGNFTFKLAAKRGYNGAVFSLYGALTTFPIIYIAVLLFSSTAQFSWVAFMAGVISGSLGAVNNVSKVLALRYIDTTIYFPLFKLLSPLFAIVAGYTLFAERFTTIEWIGLALGLFVPLLLINSAEKVRQTDLFKGLLLVLFTAVMAAAGATLVKYAVTLWPNIWWILAAQAVGVLAGSLLAVAYKSPQTIMRVFLLSDDQMMIFWAFVRSAFMSIAVLLVSYAYVLGGTLAAVHTITSMYILIPIVLAIIFYNEHWNAQKAAAIILSVVSLAFLG